MESELRAINGGFFGKITRTCDPRTGKVFFRYCIGALRAHKVFFDGAAGDEGEAVQTVKAHLARLTYADSKQRTTGRLGN